MTVLGSSPSLVTARAARHITPISYLGPHRMRESDSLRGYLFRSYLQGSVECRCVQVYEPAFNGAGCSSQVSQISYVLYPDVLE